MGVYFNEELIPDKDATNFIVQRVTKQSSATESYTMAAYSKKNDPIFLKYNHIKEAEIFVGDCDTCGWGCAEAQYDDANWGDILYLGLHIGVVPDYIYKNKSVSSLDVIEGNDELISYVTWIDNNINIINHNPWNYQPSKTYDIIICDLWAETDDITQDNKTNLVNNYNSHLKNGGKIIIPITGETIN